MSGLIILGIIVFIYILVQKKKYEAFKNQKTEEEENTIKLDINPFQYYGEEFDTWQKILNFGASKSETMTYFSYNNGIIVIRNRKNETFRCPLGGLKASFSQYRGITYINLSGRNQKMKLVMTSNFSNEQWDVIFDVLCKAAKTSGTYIFGNTYKGIKVANTALKILSHL